MTKATPLIPKSESSNANEEEEGVLSKGVLQKLLYMMVVLFIVRLLLPQRGAALKKKLNLQKK